MPWIEALRILFNLIIYTTKKRLVIKLGAGALLGPAPTAPFHRTPPLIGCLDTATAPNIDLGV